MTLAITTNHHARTPLLGHDLSEKERADFDYLDWSKPDGEGWCREFLRYRGQVIDLGDLGEDVPPELKIRGWQAWQSDSFYSGVAFRWTDDYECVIAATVIVS